MVFYLSDRKETKTEVILIFVTPALPLPNFNCMQPSSGEKKNKHSFAFGRESGESNADCLGPMLHSASTNLLILKKI